MLTRQTNKPAASARITVSAQWRSANSAASPPVVKTLTLFANPVLPTTYFSARIQLYVLKLVHGLQTVKFWYFRDTDILFDRAQISSRMITVWSTSPSPMTPLHYSPLLSKPSSIRYLSPQELTSRHKHLVAPVRDALPELYRHLL